MYNTESQVYTGVLIPILYYALLLIFFILFCVLRYTQCNTPIGKVHIVRHTLHIYKVVQSTALLLH